jgi:hypothetical protein
MKLFPIFQPDETIHFLQTLGQYDNGRVENLDAQHHRAWEGKRAIL